MFNLSEHSIIKALIEHYANVQRESEKALEEVDEGIRQELQRRKPEATVDYESFMERLEKSEEARRALLAKRRKDKPLQLTPHIHTHKFPMHTHKDPIVHNTGKNDFALIPVETWEGKRTKWK